MVTQTLATNGARVYITGRTEDKLDRVVSTYGTPSLAGEIIALPADVGTKDGVRALHAAFCEREASLDILVNNAGVASAKVETQTRSAEELQRNLFDGSSFEDWNDTYSTNVTACYFVAAAFLPQLQKASDKEHGWSATVLNISSISGLIKHAQRHFAYNASKAAAVHLTRMLAAEVASYNDFPIRVNSIAPGVFPSEMTTGRSGGDQKSEIRSRDFSHEVPAGRPGRDEDMAQAVLFCVGCRYLSGQTVVVDGGYTIEAGM